MPPSSPPATQPSNAYATLGLAVGLPVLAFAALALAVWFRSVRAHLHRQQALLASARRHKNDSFELVVRPSDLEDGSTRGVGHDRSASQPLRHAVSQVLLSQPLSAHASSAKHVRFAGGVREFITGLPSTAAGGINALLGANDDEIHAAMAGGVSAILSEFAPPRASAMAMECLQYVLHGRAAYAEINDPLRTRVAEEVGGDANDAASREGTAPTSHPFPVLINFINEGLRRLRAVNADGPKALQPMALWRGMRDVAELPAPFLESGGTELAFMSSTTRLQVALEYALLRGARDGAVVSHCLLLKMTTRTFIERGADLAYLSCYPSEAEVLFPPLTYLRPTGRATKLTSEELRAEVGAEADPSSHSHTKEALEQLAWPSITAVEVELVIP